MKKMILGGMSSNTAINIFSSIAFCRQTLTVLSENLYVIPSSVHPNKTQSDLAALDRLPPHLSRFQRLTELAEDIDAALGSDVMTLVLEGYALLKVAGRNQGLKGLRKELSARFSRGGARG